MRDWYQEAVNYHTNKYNDDLALRLDLIIKASKRLEQLLDDDFWRSFLSPSSSETTDQCLQGTRAIRETCLRQVNRSKAAMRMHQAYQSTYKVRSPFEWLVGDFLPLVYFNGGFVAIKDEKSLLAHNSPYLRFAMATVQEFGISVDGKRYARSSFLKALRNSIRNTSRRKKGASDRYAKWRARLMIQTLKPSPTEP